MQTFNVPSLTQPVLTPITFNRLFSTGRSYIVALVMLLSWHNAMFDFGALITDGMSHFCFFLF